MPLRLVESKAGHREIADDAGLSLPTVKKHVHLIFRKLEVASRSQLIALNAIRIVHDLLGLRSALMTVHAIDLAKQFAASARRRDRWCHCVGLFVCRLRVVDASFGNAIIPKRIKHRIEPKQGRSERHIRSQRTLIRNDKSFCKAAMARSGFPFAPPPGRGSRSERDIQGVFLGRIRVIARFDRANAAALSRRPCWSARDLQ